MNRKAAYNTQRQNEISDANFSLPQSGLKWLVCVSLFLLLDLDDELVLLKPGLTAIPKTIELLKRTTKQV